MFILKWAFKSSNKALFGHYRLKVAFKTEIGTKVQTGGDGGYI